MIRRAARRARTPREEMWFALLCGESARRYSKNALAIFPPSFLTSNLCVVAAVAAQLKAVVG
jgi:hypothetical protein